MKLWNCKKSIVLVACVLVTQSCPTLCDPTDCSLPGLSVHGILQARILEWIAISYSKGSSQPRDQIYISSLLHWQMGSWYAPWYFSTSQLILLLRSSRLNSCCLQMRPCWHRRSWVSGAITLPLFVRMSSLPLGAGTYIPALFPSAWLVTPSTCLVLTTLPLKSPPRSPQVWAPTAPHMFLLEALEPLDFVYFGVSLTTLWAEDRIRIQ